MDINNLLEEEFVLERPYNSQDMDTVLEDDCTPYGGTSFHGETLGDFLDEVDVSRYASKQTINDLLRECGIKTI